MTSLQDTTTTLNGPLSQLELAILLALPRAASKSPDSVLFKIPHSDNPNLGFVDTTCSEAASIVARLAHTWDSRLTETLGAPLKEKDGVVIAIASEPAVHAWFHHLAFWALGCGVQYFNANFEPGVIDNLLKQGGCSAILCSGDTLEASMRDCAQRLGIPAITLQEEEYANNLAKREKEGTQGAAPPWPTPRRPTPSVVIHSSATTNAPKLLRFPLQYWAMDLEIHLKRRAQAAQSSKPAQPPPDLKTTRLLIYPLFWMTSMKILLLHLVSQTPLALVNKADISKLSGAEILDWAVASKTDHLFTMAPQAREMLRLAFDENGSPKDPNWAAALSRLESMAVTGTNVDQELSDLFVKCNIKATNTFGNSELGGLLSGSRPPYNYLRPTPGAPSPLIMPYDHDTKLSTTDGQLTHPRTVQFWTLVSTHPHLSHNLVQGNMPVDIEPYPGPGPEHGQPAVKWGDLFHELHVPLDSPAADGSTTEVVYVHVGRENDYIGTSDGRGLSAFEVEAAISQVLETDLQRIDGWSLDAVQVFGSDRPHTAAVVQLRRDEDRTFSTEQVVSVVQKAIVDTNEKLKLPESIRIDAYSRLLIISSAGERIGPSPTKTEGKATTKPDGTLALTHKRTIQRWKNNQTFGEWLDEVCA
ncbi:hypothetical protein FRC09_013064 [Ceratobasidium sp. 395]|nr:hypothetical protein FRC09_013064 [Ceratobasidium sp. 395]